MEEEWLQERLEAGRSIESIARELGKHPSTVAYWVAKYRLGSAHAAKHAARGGIDREPLEDAIARGLSVRAIAAEQRVSYATVRHWLRKHGLETGQARRRRTTMETLADEDGREVAECPKHGRTAFGARTGGGWRCLACRGEHVVARRRRVKAILVEEAGGRCCQCGYDRSIAALQFHHRDPGQKAFSIAYRGVTRSLEAARLEAAKCALLCANCHAEVEAGVATLSAIPVDHPG